MKNLMAKTPNYIRCIKVRYTALHKYGCGMTFSLVTFE